YIVVICGISSFLAVIISLTSISLHLLNYRKPLQQRLINRIQMILPLYALSCFLNLIAPNISKYIEPIREIYESFVIYTFFTLLTDILGGERNIIIFTSGRKPIAHPLPFSLFFNPIDISDPYTFLSIKRGILQYVWIKPILCLLIAITEFFGWYDVNDLSIWSSYLWLNIAYNFSVSLSLYNLAIFWKCLYNDLMPFNPWGKFLCVKLIIFASYWQGIILGILNYLGYLDNIKNDTDIDLPKEPESNEYNLSTSIQNALLCAELILFAIGHWKSFTYKAFDFKTLPNSCRLTFKMALKDSFGIGDLIYDFRVTFNGSSYDYKNFDSVEALISHPSSSSRYARLNKGLRYYDGGKHKYWLPDRNEIMNSDQN
ncbi:Hfl1p, partial [Ascoidea rubescens DSM 1968]